LRHLIDQPGLSHPRLRNASAVHPQWIIDRWRRTSSAYTLDHASRKLARLMLRGKAKAGADSDGNFRTWIEKT
jgi:hypothetical protein